MTTHADAATATAAVALEWAEGGERYDLRPTIRERLPALAAALDALTAGTGTVLAVADAWGDLDDEKIGPEWLAVVWVAVEWAALLDVLDELLAAELFDPEGF